MKNGVFTVSLDFELYWGVRDKRALVEYQRALDGVPRAVDGMLSLFEVFSVHATWATVGFLFASDEAELALFWPKLLPEYNDCNLSPYSYLAANPSLQPPYHFAGSLIEMVASVAGQEVGSHTFSHYYCLERGQTVETFAADMNAAKAIARTRDISLKSLVFPRNQYNEQYVAELPKLGICCYRGNQQHHLYESTNMAGQGLARRALRLLDHYVNLSGQHTYPLPNAETDTAMSFPASRFLRPHAKSLAFLDWLKLRRIKVAMTDAAVNNKVFHLWWHPHNFGTSTDKNLLFLKRILQHYQKLHSEYGMQSLNLSELSDLARKRNS